MARRKTAGKIVYRKSKLPNPDGARRHTRQRGEERFELSLSRRDQARLIRMISQRRGQLLGQQDNDRQLWLLEWQGQRLPVVYDPRGAAIVSVLPQDHALVAAHIATAQAAPGRDPRLSQLKDVARDLELPPDSGPIRIGAVARHEPSGAEGPVLEADMATRTLTIRVGETGRLRDLIRCFAGPALG